MILSQVRQILLCAISEPCPPLGVMGFHQGLLLPDWLLGRMIDAATRGAITEVGIRLLLIPTNTYEQANRDSIARIRAAGKRKDGKKRNRTPWPEIQRMDCLALRDYLSMPRATETQKQCFDPAPVNGFRDANRNGKGVAKGMPKTGLNRNANCLFCGASLAGKRRGSKHCDKNCKQQAYRSRGQA